jgi:outer membrane protein
MTLFRTLIAVLVSTLFAGGVFACTPETEDCVEVGKWELSLGVGAGVRTNPLEATPDIPLFLIPEVNYNGERFFIQNLDFGFILWENATQQFNVFATPSYDQVYFHRWSPGNFFLDSNALVSSGNKGGDSEGLPVIDIGDKELVGPSFNDLRQRNLRNRRMAGLAGFEYSLSTDYVDLQLQYVSDFTDIHQGDEARITLAKHWVNGRHHIIGSLGAIWQSSEVVNYYYGITPAEADASGTYNADAALSAVARFDWNYQLTERWDLRLLGSYRQLPDEISASPLINDNKVITVFIGGVYHF